MANTKGCELVMNLVSSWTQRPRWLEPGEVEGSGGNECKEIGRQGSESPMVVGAMIHSLDFTLVVVEF